jgi:hypothetical protein
VSKIRHSGKPIFRECCTRGSEVFPSASKCMTLMEARHSGKACNTRERKTLEKENLYLTTGMDGTIYKNSSPSAFTYHSGKLASSPSAPLWHSGKGLFPECYVEALGELIFFSFLPHFFEAFLHYLKLFAQTWGNFKFFRYISFFLFC